MSRKWRNVLMIGACVVSLLGAGGVLAWHFWPEPPPPTAEDVYAAMTEVDPGELSEEELDRWVVKVADAVERLPAHEVEKFVGKAIADPKLRERFESLDEEHRKKLANLISDEQRARLMTEMVPRFVEQLKQMPPPARKLLIHGMRAAHSRRRGGKRRTMSKERFAQFHAATTPRQRARIVRAFREMGKMMEEAGIRD